MLSGLPRSETSWSEILVDQVVLSPLASDQCYSLTWVLSDQNNKLLKSYVLLKVFNWSPSIGPLVAADGNLSRLVKGATQTSLASLRIILLQFECAGHWTNLIGRFSAFSPKTIFLLVQYNRWYSRCSSRCGYKVFNWPPSGACQSFFLPLYTRGEKTIWEELGLNPGHLALPATARTTRRGLKVIKVVLSDTPTFEQVVVPPPVPTTSTWKFWFGMQIDSSVECQNPFSWLKTKKPYNLFFHAEMTFPCFSWHPRSDTVSPSVCLSLYWTRSVSL